MDLNLPQNLKLECLRSQKYSGPKKKKKKKKKPKKKKKKKKLELAENRCKTIQTLYVVCLDAVCWRTSETRLNPQCFQVSWEGARGGILASLIERNYQKLIFKS